MNAVGVGPTIPGRAGDDRALRWGKTAKRITWMVLVAGAFLAYYLLDKLAEALSLLQ